MIPFVYHISFSLSTDVVVLLEHKKARLYKPIAELVPCLVVAEGLP